MQGRVEKEESLGKLIVRRYGRQEPKDSFTAIIELLLQEKGIGRE